MAIKLTVKTLKGGKFQVECEPSNTVKQVKGIIVSGRFAVGTVKMAE